MAKYKTLRQEIRELREYIMATVPELMKAIAGNGLAIASVHDAVNAVAPFIRKALEDAASGIATPTQLADAITMLNTNTEQIAKAKDVVQQLIPSVKSPQVPTPVSDTSSPPSLIAQPSSIEEIVIKPAPEIGLPGTVAIDAQ